MDARMYARGAQVAAALIGSAALAAVLAGVGAPVYELGSGWAPPWAAKVQQADAIAAAARQQAAQAHAAGCTLPAGAAGAAGYAVANVYFGARLDWAEGERHGVANSDSVTVYRVGPAEAWRLARAGRVQVLAACA